MLLHRILCPIDFSDFSRRALDHAVAIAKRFESTISVLHVSSLAPITAYAPGSGMAPTAGLTNEDRDALLDAMRRFAEAETGAGASVEFDVLEGPAAGGILAKADAMHADLIVLGTHGRSGFERLFLGSVTEKVLRKASCPVLTVPKGLPDAVPARPGLFERIVCAVDFSDCSMHALDYATSLAQEAGGRLIVVHVFDVLPDLPVDGPETAITGPAGLEQYLALAEADRRTRLKDAIPESVRARIGVETVLANGKPYREVLRVADERGADLLVVGIHGRGAVDRLLFGSTAQHLVREASCPVLTLRKG